MSDSGQPVSETGSALDALNRVLDTFGTMAVAVSGGVDSLTLATLFHRRMATPVQMFHAVSPAVPAQATERVKALGALSVAEEADIRANVKSYMERSGRSYGLEFESYRNGSAFVHEPANCTVALL